jgi:hypothetical protein
MEEEAGNVGRSEESTWILPLGSCHSTKDSKKGLIGHLCELGLSLGINDT